MFEVSWHNARSEMYYVNSTARDRPRWRVFLPERHLYGIFLGTTEPAALPQFFPKSSLRSHKSKRIRSGIPLTASGGGAAGLHNILTELSLWLLIMLMKRALILHQDRIICKIAANYAAIWLFYKIII